MTTTEIAELYQRGIKKLITELEQFKDEALFGKPPGLFQMQAATSHCTSLAG